MPFQVTGASALPGKTRKGGNHIFTQLDCVTHTVHLCATFLKEKVVICDVFDSVYTSVEIVRYPIKIVH